MHTHIYIYIYIYAYTHIHFETSDLTFRGMILQHRWRITWNALSSALPWWGHPSERLGFLSLLCGRKYMIGRYIYIYMFINYWLYIIDFKRWQFLHNIWGFMLFCHESRMVQWKWDCLPQNCMEFHWVNLGTGQFDGLKFRFLPPLWWSGWRNICYPTRYVYVCVYKYIYTYTVYIYIYIHILKKKGLATKNLTDLAWW
jgi:hypothetical protein